MADDNIPQFAKVHENDENNNVDLLINVEDESLIKRRLQTDNSTAPSTQSTSAPSKSPSTAPSMLPTKGPTKPGDTVSGLKCIIA